MKALLIFLVTANALAIECELVGERKFKQLTEELVMEGKGVSEVNDILRARINICRDQCPPVSGLGICMAKLKGKKDGK